MFEQHCQELKRLLLQPDAQAVLAQFARTHIQFKDPKANLSANRIAFRHFGAELIA